MQLCDNSSIHTIRHYLITCLPVATFWQSFVVWWNKLEYAKLIPLVEENIFLGFPGVTTEDIVLHFCLMVANNHYQG
jgi:hypothetical protein